jgi:hypothetical protein
LIRLNLSEFCIKINKRDYKYWKHWDIFPATKNLAIFQTKKLEIIILNFAEYLLKALGILIYLHHRCSINASFHNITGLVAYQLRQDKPSLKTLKQKLG